MKTPPPNPACCRPEANRQHRARVKMAPPSALTVPYRLRAEIRHRLTCAVWKTRGVTVIARTSAGAVDCHLLSTSNCPVGV